MKPSFVLSETGDTKHNIYHVSNFSCKAVDYRRHNTRGVGYGLDSTGWLPGWALESPSTESLVYFSVVWCSVV